MKFHLKSYAFKSIAFLLILGFFSCEEEYFPDINSESENIVVEGFIEAGKDALVPYVILTKSSPYYASFSGNDIANLYIHDATVRVSEGNQEYEFTELCLFDELEEYQIEIFSKIFGFENDSLGFNYCVYVDLSGQLFGEVGKTYALDIKANGKILSAETSIPSHVPLDSLYFQAPPGENSNTYRQLICSLEDPENTINYYRYFTRINKELLIGSFQSILNDQLFNGEHIEFPLIKNGSRNAEFSQATFGLFRKGATATIKWSNMDQAHYNFWNTIEFNAANQGPFSSYSQVASNIKGGLGIWGGYSVSVYTLIVDP